MNPLAQVCRKPCFIDFLTIVTTYRLRVIRVRPVSWLYLFWGGSVEGKINLQAVKSLGANQVQWDPTLSGFGIRRQGGKVVSYILKYVTVDGRQRLYTIGKHGKPWNPATARDEAIRLLGEIVSKQDPAADKKSRRQAATVAELCDMYLADVEAGRVLIKGKPKKASTIVTDRGRIERHIKPLLGSLKVAAVTSHDIEVFMHAVADGKTAGKTKTAKKRGLANVRGGKGAASRTVGLLGGIFTYAIKHKMRPNNPVAGIERYADGERDRRLTDAEYQALGKVLNAPSKIWPPAIAAAHFLLLTGWRKGEVLNLRQGAIDLARRTATLGDTKTSRFVPRSIRPLSQAACDLLASHMRVKDSDLIFPAARGTGPMSFQKAFAKIIELAALPADITPHVLRHSFASIAGDLGYSELTIAALIGHAKGSVTSKYVHAADAVLLAAADAVANRTVELMCGTQSEAVAA
jgi:integrase